MKEYKALFRRDDRRWILANRAGWIGVPFATSPDLVRDGPEPYVDAAASVGDGSLVLNVAEPDGVTEIVVPADVSSLRNAVGALLLDTFVISSPSTRWLALISEAEYGVCVGEPALVAGIVGASQDYALAEFARYTEEWTRRPAYLDAVLNLPWHEFGRPDTRSEFMLPPPL